MHEESRQVEFDRLPVNLNNGYVHVCTKGGKLRKFPSKEVRAWQEEIAWAFKGKWSKIKKYGVEILIEMGDKRKRDVDSGTKFILDALTGVVWKDDNDVLEVHIFKSRTKEHKTTISVYSL